MSISQRLDIHAVDPEAYKPMMALEKYVHSGSLGEALIGLVKFRASQINGCAYCLDMHGDECRKAGVDQRKLDVLSGWHEAPALYSEREQAALALTEEVTRISEHGVSDATWLRAHKAFSEKELVQLLMGISAINVWNRLAITVHLDLPAAKK
ncbi:MAG TPA: carboxymuconolactone decarboxylase family protein [Castellaniella sp.]|uniref:carboxymuconolactone decarboxylase family protein n=1 Tax=Castellaniella sp. TaxID=1955812 RepID=UPI002F1ED060